MSSQGLSRKRPAPGTSPLAHQQIPSLPNFSGADPHLTNEQFLQQWAPNAPPTISPSNPNAGHFQHVNDRGDAGNLQLSNQLARRPGAQIISRSRVPEQNLMPLVDQGSMRPSDQGGTGMSETDAELAQRAHLAKKDAQAKRKQIPPFIQKLRSFLDESKNTELIRWSTDGNSFVVLDEDEFAKNLIPELFKHNNYASFVRQLNMYGFHKKVGLSDNSMRASERKNKSPSEYSNPYFKRGHPDLLWLIQKPKNISGQGKGSAKGAARVKSEVDAEDIDQDELGDEGGGRDDRTRFRGQLTLGLGDEPVEKDQLSNVYRELQTIRHQQQIISSTISKLRREHEQLYEQAANFQEQHSRHENSINAILTFLATVYNRSLQGHEGAQGLVNSFAGAISQDQGQVNIVDVGDFIGNIDPDPNVAQRPFKKQRLLLNAPPLGGQGGQSPRLDTLSPSTAGSPYDVNQDPKRQHSRKPSAQSGNVEELLDTPQNPNTRNQQQQQQHQPQHQPQQPQPSQQPQPPQHQHQQQHHQSPAQPQEKDPGTSSFLPQRDIMSLIQNTNARNNLQSNPSDFPTVLSSLETSDGNSPLTAAQRADMLRLMAHENHTNDPSATAAASSNNALITPNPPPMPQNYPTRLANTRSEIDNLVKMQAEQARSVQNLTNMLQPLSPTGSIPGLEPDNPNSNIPPPPLDLDQIFNSDYFSDFPEMDSKPGGQGSAAATYGTGQLGREDATTAAEANDANHNNNANDTLAGQGSELFDFDNLAADAAVGEVFGNTNQTVDQQQQQQQRQRQRQPQHIPGYFDGFGPFDGGNKNDRSGQRNVPTSHNINLAGSNDRGMPRDANGNRITEAFTSSEGTSPANTSIDENLQAMDNGNVARSRSAATVDNPTSINNRRNRNQ